MNHLAAGRMKKVQKSRLWYRGAVLLKLNALVARQGVSYAKIGTKYESSFTIKLNVVDTEE